MVLRQLSWQLGTAHTRAIKSQTAALTSSLSACTRRGQAFGRLALSAHSCKPNNAQGRGPRDAGTAHRPAAGTAGAARAAVAPLVSALALFAAIVLVSIAVIMLGPIAHVQVNSRCYSAVPPKPCAWLPLRALSNAKE